MADAASENRSNALSVPWTDVVRFVRQLSHDLRNHLNAASLTAAYLNEVATDAEVKIEIKRLLNVDPQLLQQAIIELFSNAFRHHRGEGSLIAFGKIDNQRFVFGLLEPKSRFDLPTENWGREPLHNVAPGHYGLGLHRARAIIEAHGGELHARYEPGESVLVTTITLPLSA